MSLSCSLSKTYVYVWSSLFSLVYVGKHQYFKNLADNARNFRNLTVTRSSCHQLKQCWEFLPINILSDFEKVPGRSVSTPLLSLPIDLQTVIKASDNFKIGELEGKVIQRVSEVTVDSIKYAVRDVLAIDLLHVEKIPFFGQIKYILNIDTMWVLCSKILLPLSFDMHYHAYRIKVDSDWILLKPGEKLDHMPLDTYTVDDNLYVGLRHLVRMLASFWQGYMNGRLSVVHVLVSETGRTQDTNAGWFPNKSLFC